VQAREFIIDAGKPELQALRLNSNGENAWLRVREVLKREDGSQIYWTEEKSLCAKARSLRSRCTQMLPKPI
jgi:hypothetical protein